MAVQLGHSYVVYIGILLKYQLIVLTVRNSVECFRSRLYKKAFEQSTMFRSFHSTESVLESSTMIWDVLECSTLFLDIAKHCTKCWNALECCARKYFRIFWNDQVYSRTIEWLTYLNNFVTYITTPKFKQMHTSDFIKIVNLCGNIKISHFMPTEIPIHLIIVP